MKIRYAFIIIILTAFSTIAYSFWGHEIIKTPYFVVFYPRGHEDKAIVALNSLEYYRQYVEALTGNKKKRTSILLEDSGMLTNGYANPVFDRVSLFTYSPSAGELQNMENWMTGVAVHEYAHILQMQNSSGIPGILTGIFGNALSPNMLCPYWMVEGIAVYAESNYSKYSGRLNDSYYSSFAQIAYSEGKFPSIIEATYYPVEYPGGTSYYLYGGLFTEYLAREYGEGSLAKFFDLNGRSLLSYLSPLFPFAGIDRSAKRVFGKRLPQLWDDFRLYQESRCFEDHNYQRITELGWRMDNLTSHRDILYFQRSYPVKTSTFSSFYFNDIIRLDPLNNKMDIIITSLSSFSHPVKFYEDRIYYIIEDFRKGFRNQTYSSFGFVALLYEYNTVTGKKRFLLKDNIRAFDVLNNGQILISRDRESGFGSSLYLYSKNKGKTEILYSGELLIDRIVSDGDRIILTAKKDFSNFGIYSFKPGTGELIEIINMPSIQSGPFIVNERLIFTSNHNNNLICLVYDFNTGKFHRQKGGFYTKTPVLNKNEDTVYFIGLTPDGNDIFSMDFEPLPFYFEKQDHKPHVPDPVAFGKGNYFDNLRTLYPKIRLPYFMFTEQEEQAGIFLSGEDAIGHFLYEIDINYDFIDKTTQARFFLGSTLFSPFYFRIGYEESNNGTYSSFIQYPLLHRVSSHFSRLYLGVYAESYDRNNRKEVLPFVHLGFQYRYGLINTYHYYIIESPSLDSMYSRNGFINRLNIRQYIKNSELSLAYLNIYDKDYSGYYSYSIRGYSAKIRTNNLHAGKLDFSIPVFSLRKGLWDPNIFFEDIIANMFFDYAWSRGHEFLAGGLELHLETHALFNFRFDLYIRASINKENERTISFGIISSDIFGIIGRRFNKEVY